jgi:hypothetical protein
MPRVCGFPSAPGRFTQRQAVWSWSFPKAVETGSKDFNASLVETLSSCRRVISVSFNQSLIGRSSKKAAGVEL